MFDVKLLFVVGGVLSSTCAQILLKQASGGAPARITWYSLLGGSSLLYLCSFCMYYFALKHFPISKVSPVMTTGVVLFVVIFGMCIGENVTLLQGIGIILGMLSIVFILY